MTIKVLYGNPKAENRFVRLVASDVATAKPRLGVLFCKNLVWLACCLFAVVRADADDFTVTASSQTNGRLSSLTLAFPAATQASSIWVASGPTDAGEVLGNWQSLYFGADIAAGATSCTIPVKLQGGETAMRLLMLANSDEFVELESVSSEGNAYVTTGFVPGGNTFVRCDLKWDVCKGSAIFGARAGAGKSSFSLLELTKDGWRYDYADEIKNSYFNPVVGRRYIAEMDHESLRVNGVAVQNCSRKAGAASFSAGCGLMLFAMNNAGTYSSPAQATIYSLKAWSNLNDPSTLVSDLVPCLANGVAGFVNRKTRAFQTNTGTLKAGPAAAHSTLGTLVASSGLIDACGLTRTMSVVKQYRQRKRVTADLAFTPALSDSLLIAAYGATDAGTKLSDWPSTELLGIVPAATTQKTVQISKVIDDELKVIRYFLVPRCASAAYDRQFEGIRATGTQYALTDFTPTQSAGVIADFTFDTVEETQVPFSARSAAGSNAFAVLYTTAQGFRLDYQSAMINSQVKMTAETKFRLDMSTYLNINNSRVATVPDANKQNFTAGSPLTLFALNTAGSVGSCSKAVCHAFYAWSSMGNDTTRVLDLVPCEKNGEIGFYNKVNGKFYGNSGAGMFEAVGPEKINVNAQVVSVSSAMMQPPPNGLIIHMR